MRVINVTPGLLPIPPNGWGAVEKIIWEYHKNLLNLGIDSKILYLDQVEHDESTVVHIHVANLALMAKERDIPYYFTCHDHHAYLYGKNSVCFKENYDAIKYSLKSFVPAKYLVDYFDLPNLEYLSHGVDIEYFKPSSEKITEHKLLCVANNGFSHDPSEDRKGFGYAIEAAKKLNLPITIAGPSNNKKFFTKYNSDYEKLYKLYDLNETELLNVYQNHTVFLHPSILEAGHPNLTLLEAMGCGLPVVGTYEDNNELSGLYKISRNVDEIVDGIKCVIKDYEIYKSKSLETACKKSWKNITETLLNSYKYNMKDQLLNIYNSTKINHKDPAEPTNDIIIDYNNGCKVEILGSINKKYNIKFINKKTNQLVYETNINNNMWCSTSIVYYVDWHVKVTDLDTKKVLDFHADLNGKRIRIINESPSLGDYISWMPFVDLFQKTHDCIVDFYTPNKEIFNSSYTNINFFDYNHLIHNISSYYATYKIGCFQYEDRSLSPKDYREQNLQQIAAEILGLNYKDTKPNLLVKNTTRNIEDKYVCISTASTAGCKHWQNETGWQETVNYLNELGYKVVVLQKEPLNYMDLKGLNNIIHPETKTLDDVVNWLYNCEFFIGLSSGVSWLAWAINKKVILISGFTKKYNEFFTPFRVINESVCNGCWNNPKHKFDAGDWNWCPIYKNTNKQFECSKQITFEMVKIQINKLLNNDTISNSNNFDEFTYKEIFEWNQYEKFVTVDKNDVILDLGCSKGYFYFKHKDKNIEYIGVDGSTDCLNDFIENLNGNTNPKLIHALIDNVRSIQTFASMFHGNITQKSMSITFDDILKIINRKIDFLKFDIEGYEKCIFIDNYDLFKKTVSKFSGEFHFTGQHFPRQISVETIKKLKNDKDLVIKLFSIDGVDITESFWFNTDYYTEIIVSGYIIK